MGLRELAFAAAMAAIAVPSVATAQTVLKLGHGPSAPHYTAGARVMAEEVEKGTGGKYKIEIFPNAALGNEREMVEGAQLGTVDLVITSSGPVGNFVREALIFDVPFLFRDAKHAHAVLDGPIGQDILDKFKQRNLIGLAWSETGMRHLTNSKRAVNTPQDFQGLKIRTMENPVHIAAFKNFGALPTPMSFTELFTALQQGTVDGQENPVGVILAGKFFQVQKFLTLTGHVYGPAVVIASPTVWNRLTPAEQKVFVDGARKGAATTRKMVADAEQSAIDELRKNGMDVVVVTDRTPFQAALADAYKEYAKQFGQDSLDRIRNYRE